MRTIVVLLALVAAAQAATKLDALKAKVLAPTTDAGCVARGGKCGKVSACGGSVVRGLCPGDATVSCCVPPPPVPSTPSVAGLVALADLPLYAQCTAFSWADRGRAPKAYVKGVLATFAKAVCEPARADVVHVGQSGTGTPEKDALNWYADKLKPLFGTPVTGLVTVRQLYTLLMGLGMRESSGKWCVGRDMSADFSTADSAEAGLYQTSYGSKRAATTLLTNLYAKYKASKSGCLAAVFQSGVTCKAGDLKNWGTGEGLTWQQLTKDCPAFAAEWAAVLLRVNGGSKGEWGPLRKKDAQLNPTCHQLLGAAQQYVQTNPQVCAMLNASL